MSAAREQVVCYALSVVGLTAPAPEYLALAAPAEETAGDAVEAEQVAKVSDCILVRMGIEDATTYLEELLEANKKDGTAGAEDDRKRDDHGRFA